MSSAQLADLVESRSLLTDHQELAARRRDSWPLQWVRDSRGDLVITPEAVVLPSSTDEVARVVRWANETETSLIIRGAGSGVCGGAMPVDGCVVLETTRLNRIVTIDPVSMMAEVEAGVNGDVLEEALSNHGLTLGHYPQSMGISTVGGWLSTSSAGQASPGFGFIEDRVVGLEAVLGDGGILTIPPSARSSVGPDLKRLFIGAEGRLAVITKVFLACSPAWRNPQWQAFRFEHFESTLRFARAVQHSDAQPTVLRGWDAPDTEATFGSFGRQGKCVSVVGFKGEVPGLDGRQDAIRGLATALGAAEIPAEYGEHWWNNRLNAVQTFTDVLGARRLWGTDVILDTSELSALWSNASTVYRGVVDAIAGSVEWVRCHFSHVFDVGVALYFTFLVRASSVDELECLYRRTWRRIMEEGTAAGASLSHHHGMGRLKAEFTPASIGDSAVGVLERIAAEFDPNSVLNPGVLLTD